MPDLIVELVYPYIKIPVHFYHSQLSWRTKSLLLHQANEPGAESDSKACKDNILTASTGVGTCIPAA